MSREQEALSELIRLRVRAEYLEQDLTDVLHLFYGILTWLLTLVPPELEEKIAKVVRFKLLQLPQGSRIGQRLIALDEQFGGLLESKGIWLSHWVYEPREK